MHPGTVQCTFTAWHSETQGANGSEPERTSDREFARMRALTDVTGETLRRWREAKGWDVPRMARELRKVAKDSGEDVAAHHGLVKMIPQWERGGRVPRERYRLLYLKIFADTLGDLSLGMAFGTDTVLRLAEVRSRAARLPGPDEIRALEGAALAKPRETITPAEIRALAAEAIAHLHEVADKLAELSALLGDDEAGEDKP
jgi:transcriptional regulator with XRE-family HTH domain